MLKPGIILRSDTRDRADASRPGLLVWEAHSNWPPRMLRPGITTGEIVRRRGRLLPRARQRHPAVQRRPRTRPLPGRHLHVDRRRGRPRNPRPPHPRRKARSSASTPAANSTAGAATAAVTHPIGTDRPRRSSDLLEVTSGVLDLAIQRMGTCKSPLERGRRRDGAATSEDRETSPSSRPSSATASDGEMHEDPQVPNFVSPQLRDGNGDFRLEPGLVIAVEPMVNMGTKSVRTQAGPLDPGHRRCPTQRPLRTHHRHDRVPGPTSSPQRPANHWTREIP